jgi:hypothetical protein
MKGPSKMTMAELCADVMSVLWGDTDSSHTGVARACAAYVKTHRTNVENLFDVIGILYRDEAHVVHMREADAVRAGDVAPATLYVATVAFIDGSSCVVECTDGIGHSCEPL